MSERPRLGKHIAAVTLLDLPEWSAGPRQTHDKIADSLIEHEYEAVQTHRLDQASHLQHAGLEVHALNRATTVSEIATAVSRWADAGAASITFHLGTAFESDAEALDLIEGFLNVSRHAAVPLLVETHRATVMQDPARTLGFVARFPELRFTADLSHWYTGGEMPYGGFEWKLEALRPVFDRIGYIHGRISDPGCAQVSVEPDDQSRHVCHFAQMWKAVFRSFIERAEGDSELPFAPELLPPAFNYDRTIPDTTGGRREESDRWQQAALLHDMASDLFEGELTSVDRRI